MSNDTILAKSKFIGRKVAELHLVAHTPWPCDGRCDGCAACKGVFDGLSVVDPIQPAFNCTSETVCVAEFVRVSGLRKTRL